MIQIVGEQHLDGLVTGLAQFSQGLQGQLHVGAANQLASGGIHVIFCRYFADNVFNRHVDTLNAVFLQLADMTSGDATAFLYVHFAVSFDIKGRGFTTQTLWNQSHL